MANNYFTFSPNAFEQFARSVAVSVLGPGVTAFGNGPDGGREATFRGKVPYPYPPATQWSGYGVIQAKCKEKTESTRKDQEWATAQLAEELDAFVSSTKRNPKPEYYVFVTNVELSSTSGGAKDQAEACLQSYYTRLPLKAHAVWDANQLDVFVARYEELRRRYKDYLTPGDVLAAMQDDIERRTPNAKHIVSTFIEKELRADEVSRLDQAGNRTDQQLRLAQLFIDLPASKEPQLLPPDEQPNTEGRLPHGVLYELLSNASRKLDPISLYEQETAAQQADEWFPTRFVLLGGPGSGKSTVSQFLAQIHRAALLARSKPCLLDPSSVQIIKDTEQFCLLERLPWPAAPRSPFRVELNRFAKALASTETDRVATLEGYLLNQLRREHQMTHQDFLNWLSAYPSLLILDGLDEVPPTSNRRVVVDAVNGFLAELRQAGADVFVVATCREQGYGGEFAGVTVAYRRLLPLSQARALQYVERYAHARFGKSDPTKAVDVVEKIRESGRRGLTAELMKSPLQVTFMATVVAARGDPGRNRWQLFTSYYRTIYDRELQKAISPYAAVLSRQQPIIDRLHHDVGFLLQHRGETEGAAAASLPLDEFRRLVDSYLTETGSEGAEKDELANIVTDAASCRLVFLTGRLPGELSFDVPSLQEYMAAECLMTGTPELVKARLRAIAPTPYWRNTFLFAASKCFADSQSRHLQDTLRLLCEDLNRSSTAMLEATKAGSELAVDILASGAVAENPSHARHLARTAFELLSEPCEPAAPLLRAPQDVQVVYKLLRGYTEALKAVYLSELELRIGQANAERTIGAWRLLWVLGRYGVEWAREIAARKWPADPDAKVTIILKAGSLPGSFNDPWWNKKFAELWDAPVSTIDRHFGYNRTSRTNPPACDLAKILDYFRLRSNYGIALRVDGATVKGPGLSSLHLVFAHVPSWITLPDLPRPFSGHPSWLLLFSAKKFLDLPNAVTLASVIDELADYWTGAPEPGMLYLLPWPLANCLGAVQDVRDCRELAQKVRAGVFGDRADWMASESRWSYEGIAIETICDWPPAGLALDERGHLGAHRFCSGGVSQRTCSSSVRGRLFQVAQTAKAAEARSIAAWWWALTGYGVGSDGIEPSAFLSPCFPELGRLWVYLNPGAELATDAWLDAFDSVGRLDILPALDATFTDFHWREWCVPFQAALIDSHARPKPFRFGLLRLLSRMAAVGTAIEIVPASMLDIDSHAEPSFAEPRYRLAAVIVRLAQSSLTPEAAEGLAGEAAAILEDPRAEPNTLELIFATVESHLDRVPSIVRFVLRLREKMPPKVELGTAKCDGVLRRALRGQPSGLQLENRLREMQLPLVPQV